MDILKQIEGSAFTVLNIHLRMALTGELEDCNIVEQITIAPEVLVQYVCSDINSDIDKLVAMTTEQREAGMAFVKGVMDKDRTSAIGDALSTAGYFINPLGSTVRKELRKVINDDPVYIELRNLYAGFGMDLVLGVLDELIKRGASPDELLFSINKFALEVGYDELLDAEVGANIENGIASGKNQKTEAKVAEVAAGAGGAIVGAKVGAVVGSVVPVFGTVVGAAVGGTLGNALAKEHGNKLGQDHEETVAQVIEEAKAAKEKVFSWFK